MPHSGGQKGHSDQKVTQSHPIDARVARIAAEQFGLITVAQLYGLGLTYTEVRGRVRRGRLFPLHRGVYAVGRDDISPRGHLRAAVFAVNDKGFLSHNTSLAAQGLRKIDTHNIHVTVIASSTPKRPGLIIHRTASAPHRSEIRDRFGLRYSSLPRALVEIAPDERPAELLRLVTVGIHKNIVDIRSIGETIARHERRPGVGILQSALGRYLDTADRSSGLEVDFDDYCSSDSRIPCYEKNVRMGPYEFDVVFREQKLIVELDGRPYHVALRDMENDRAKDIWAQRQGMMIMRITDFTWEHDRAQAIEDLLGLLALGGWIPGGISTAA
jgi:hypothetical protein